MKTAVVFYSRTGSTEKVARTLAEKLGADVLQIKSELYPFGWRGYFRAIRHAIGKKPAPVEYSELDLKNYDLVYIGTPIWGSHVSAPVRSFLQERGGEIRRAAFFLTCGGSGARAVFAQMTRLLRRKPVATLVLTAKDFGTPAFAEKIGTFVVDSRRTERMPAGARPPIPAT